MKSKLVMLISVAALAFSANAMALGKPVQGSARKPVAISSSAKGVTSTARSANAKRTSSTAVPQPHTILNGAKNNF